MKPISRRHFLKGTVAAGIAATMGTQALMPPFSRAQGANNDIRIGVIGLGSKVKIGGKGKKDIQDFRNVPGVRIVALCDVDQAILDEQANVFKQRNETVAAYTDLRKMLESKEIDAVSITTPNHWHALATIMACQAGKDVFVQKPASHNIFEGRKMVEAAAKYNRIVMCTSGSRERTGYTEALAFLREGKLGKPRLIYGLNYKPRPSIGKVSGPQPAPASVDYDLWSGPAPMDPIHREYFHYDWHWFWNTGNGDLGNMGIHFIDGCRMATGQSALPRHAMSVGGRFGYEDDGETPNTHLMYFDYEPAPILFEVRGLPRDPSLMKMDERYRVPSWGANAMDSFNGVQVGLTILCEEGSVAFSSPGKVTALDRQGAVIREFEGTTPGQNENFIECMRSRKPQDLVATIEDGHLSAALVHMGNISHRVGKSAPAGEIKERMEGKKDLTEAFERMQAHLAANGADLEKSPLVLGPMLTMDPEKETFVGEFAGEANGLLSREYREPFVVRKEV